MNKLYLCSICKKANPASKWNNNTSNCLWGEETGFYPIEKVKDYIVLYYNCPSCKNRINNKNIKRINK